MKIFFLITLLTIFTNTISFCAYGSFDSIDELDSINKASHCVKKVGKFICKEDKKNKHKKKKISKQEIVEENIFKDKNPPKKDVCKAIIANHYLKMIKLGLSIIIIVLVAL